MHACLRENGRRQVHLNYRLEIRTGLQTRRPLRKHRNADAALPSLSFASTQRGVLWGVARVARNPAAVVAVKTHQRILLHTGFTDGRKHPADVVVHRRKHGRIAAAARLPSAARRVRRLFVSISVGWLKVGSMSAPCGRETKISSGEPQPRARGKRTPFHRARTPARLRHGKRGLQLTFHGTPPRERAALRCPVH